CMTDTPELGEQLAELLLCADRAAADERDARDDLVREEAVARRGEEVVLVAAQAEEGEAVLAVAPHELPDDAPLIRRLTYAVGDRPQPEVQGACTEDDGQPDERVLPAVVLEAAYLQRRREGRERTEGGRRGEQRPHRAGVARHVEALAEADERDEQDQP